MHCKSNTLANRTNSARKFLKLLEPVDLKESFSRTIVCVAVPKSGKPPFIRLIQLTFGYSKEFPFDSKVSGFSFAVFLRAATPLTTLQRLCLGVTSLRTCRVQAALPGMQQYR